MVPPAILPHTALAAVNVGSRIKIYFQGETGALYELLTEDDRVYVCKEVVMPKRLDGFFPRMFTPLAACVYDDGVEVRIYFLDENSVIRELCWTAGHNGGLWYLGELGQLGIVAAHYSDLAVVHFAGNFRLYYQSLKDNMIAEVCRKENDLWVKGPSLVVATPGTRLAATISGPADLVNVYYQEKNLHPSVMVISPKETTVETAFSSEIPLPHRSPLAALSLKLHTHNAGAGMSVYTQLQDNLIGKLWSSTEDPDWDFDILVDCGPLTSIAVVSGVKADDDWSDGLRVFFVSQDPRMVVDGQDSMVVIGKKAWSEVKGWLVEKRVTPVYPRGDWESIEMHGLTTSVAGAEEDV